MQVLLVSVDFSPNGKHIVSSSFDTTLKIWDAEFGTEITTLIGHESRVNSCVWSKEGDFIASVSDDGNVKIWNPLSSTEIGTLIGHSGPVRSISFGTGNQIISSSDDKTARIWELEENTKVHESFNMSLENEKEPHKKQAFSGHVAQINDCRLSDGLDLMITASDDMTCRVWNLETTNNVRVFSSQKRPYTSCDISNSNLIAMTTDMGSLYIYDVRGNNTIFETQISSKPLTKCRFINDEFIVVGGWDCDVSLVHFTTGNVVSSKYPHSDWITSISASPDSKYVASAGWSEVIHVYKAELEGDMLTSDTILSGHTNTITSCEFSLDSKYLATSSFDSTVKLWDLKTKKFMSNVVGHHGKVNALSFGSSDSNPYLISGGEDRYIKFWDMKYYGGYLVQEFVCQGPVSSIHCSKSSTNLVMVAGDKIGNVYLCHEILGR